MRASLKTKVQSVILNEIRGKIEHQEEMIGMCENGETSHAIATVQLALWNAALAGIIEEIDS